ncbi:MAG: uncharacterized small protein (DUF1192 family), partial [Oceanospirillaceae bacterium]
RCHEVRNNELHLLSIDKLNERSGRQSRSILKSNLQGIFVNMQ